MLCAANNHGN
ncbi:hypothetical protein YPPY32_3066, partial [Yersinia pestis PY-32]